MENTENMAKIIPFSRYEEITVGSKTVKYDRKEKVCTVEMDGETVTMTKDQMYGMLWEDVMRGGKTEY